MTTTTLAATFADLEQHPGRCELIDGEIIDMAPNGFLHARVMTRVARLLDDHIAGVGAILSGDPGFIWNESNVRAPDVAYLSPEQVRQAPRRGFMTLVPLLVVEVVSPTDRWNEVRAKARGWIEHGAQLVWVVDPDENSVDVYVAGASAPLVLSATDTLTGAPVLPGFSVLVGSLFP